MVFMSDKIERLLDPKFYLENFTKIKGKTPGLIPFILTEAQKDLYNLLKKSNRVIVTKARQIGFCLDKDTKVLRSNLTWTRIDDLAEGDELVAVDENTTRFSHRKMCKSVVEKKWTVKEEAFLITFDDGRKVTATGGHRFLCNKWLSEGSHDSVWVKVVDMKIGQSIHYITSSGARGDLLRVFGKVQSKRSSGRDWWVGKKPPSNGSSWVRVISIEPVGVREMVDLQTSTKTFIAEGFVSHNSTAISGYLYHKTITTPGTTTALVAHKSEVAAEFLDKVKTFWRTTPESLRPQIHFNSKYEMSFPALDSKIVVMSGENVGRGYTIHNALCLSGDTIVYKKNGGNIPIKKLREGDIIINGKGGYSKVDKVIKRDNYEDLISLDVVGMHTPLILTGDHKVLIRSKGGVKKWTPAEKINEKNMIGIPSGCKLKNILGVNPGQETWLKGKEYYWAKVRSSSSINGDEHRVVYDVVLRGEPHSFLTHAGVVHNCSELAQWEKADEMMLALENAVPANGKIIIESTPFGVGDLFHRMWSAKNNGYDKKQYGWWWHYTEEEIEEIRKRINDPLKFAQEYELEFLASGRQVFDPHLIRHIKREILDVGTITTLDDGSSHVVKEEDDGLRIYRPPREGGLYVVGVDVAEGVVGGDYSVATIFDRKSGEEVAFYRGHIAADRFGNKLVEWGKLYNNALMVVEINNHGLTTITALKNAMYPNLYFRPSKFDTMGTQWSDRLGWKTTRVTRPLMIDDLNDSLREKSIHLHSRETIDEMITFIFDGSNNMGPMRGFHDDCIFSAAIAFQGFKVLYDKPLDQMNYEDHLPSSTPY